MVGHREGGGGTRRGLAATAVALVAIGIATLTPATPSATSGWKSCFVCGDRGVADILVNIILFVPFGAGLALAGARWSRTWLLGIAVSATVEYAQLFLPGRNSSLGDVCTNSVGALAGWAAVWLFTVTVRRARHPTLWSSVAACAPAVATIVGTGALLHPAYPPTTYYGQWTPDLGDLEWYRGRVLHASLGGLPLPGREFDDSRRVQALLSAGAPLEVRALAGPPVQHLGSLFSIYDEAEREILLIGPNRDEWVFRHRTRAAAWRLDQPDIRLAVPMPHPGDTVVVSFRSSGHGFCIRVDASARCGAGFTAGTGWGLLMYPKSWPQWLRALVGVGWMAGLWLPAGFFGASRRMLPVVGGVATLTLVLIAPLSGLVASAPGEWVGAACGLLAGAMCRRASVGGPAPIPSSARAAAAKP